MQGRVVLGIAFVLVGLLGALVLIPLSMMGAGVIGDWSEAGDYERSSMSMERAEYLTNQYLASLNDPDPAIEEIMEFEQNHYVIYCERSSGVGATRLTFQPLKCLLAR